MTPFGLRCVNEDWTQTNIVLIARVYNSTLGSVAIAMVSFKTTSDVVKERKRIAV